MSTSAFERDENELNPITAGIGFGTGANNGFWEIQPRKKWGKGRGQWLPMGAKLRGLFKINGIFQSRTGRAIGSNGTPNGVRFLPDAGQEGIDSNKIYNVSTDHIEEIAGVLPEDYLKSKGIDTEGLGQQKTDSAVSTATIPEISELETAPVTPDDLRLANDGINSPEGQQQEAFKDSPEGQAVARLDEETASNVQPGLERGFRPYDGSGRFAPDNNSKIIEYAGELPGVNADQIPEEREQMEAIMDGSYYDGRMSFEDKVRISRAIAKKDGTTSIYDLSDEELMDLEKTGKLTGTAMRARGEMARRGLIPEYRNLKGGRDKDVDFGKTVPPIERDIDAEIAKAEADVANMPEGSASDAAFDLAYKKIDILKAERDRRASGPADNEISSEAKASDIVSRAMDGEDIDIDQELDDFLQNPDEVDVEDINVGQDGKSQITDPEFDMEPVAKSAVSADEVAVDDFIDDENGGFFKVTSADVDEDGNWEIFGVDKDGDEASLFGNRSDRVRRIDEFDEPGNMPAMVPATPAPAQVAKPKAEMPADATPLDSAWDAKPGDVLYNRDGSKLGTVESMTKSGSYANPNKSAEVVLLGDDGSKSKKMIMDSQKLSRVAAPEVQKAPEPTPAPTDAPTANAAGFTESGRWELGGMKRTRQDGVGESYARALNNGRTSTIAKDTDGSWFLEKHDEFNGGIKEVKRFDSLDDALAEGTDFLKNNDPKFDAPGQPAEIPQSKNQPIIETPAEPQAQAAPASPPNGPNGPAAGDDNGGGRITVENLKEGMTFWDKSGKPHSVLNVANDNGKVTIDYTDENGEAKSKRFREGTPVDLQPNEGESISSERSNTPATQEQKDTIAELDSMDSEDPIQDEDLRDQLMDAFNAIQDGEDLDEGELQDLIDAVNNYYISKSGGSTSGPSSTAMRRIDSGKLIDPTGKSIDEMRNTKVKKTNGGTDADAILDQLTKDYPDGGFIDDPADELNGGFVTRRELIDGGATTMETVVLRTIGNKFIVSYRFTNNATGDKQTFQHKKRRDSYTALHNKDYGIDALADYFNGNNSPVPLNGKSREAAYFKPGGTWQDRMKYWRKGNVSYSRDTMTDEQLARLERDFNGNVEAMSMADSIVRTKMRTPEEMMLNLLYGQDEALNENVIQLGTKLRSAIPSFFAMAEMQDLDYNYVKARFQELMNHIPENNPEAFALFVSSMRDGFKKRIAETLSGASLAERKRAGQVASAAVTNYLKWGQKQFTADNDMKLPHVSGSGVRVIKKGSLVEWEDNMGNKFVGRVVGLRRESGPNGYNDFARLQFMGKDGKARTTNADFNSNKMKAVDAGTPLSQIDEANWKRLGDLTFTRLGQEAADIRGEARKERGMSWQDPTSPDYIPNLGSDGELGEDSDEEPGSFPVPKSGSKPASELIPGDTVYDNNGTALGTITAAKMTSKNGEPIMAVKYRDGEGNSHTVAYHVDQMVGPNERDDNGGDDSKK